MFSIKIVFFLLAVLAIVATSQPTRHQQIGRRHKSLKRGTCPKGSTTAAAATKTKTATATSATVTKSVSDSDSDDEVSTKKSTTKTKTSTSTADDSSETSVNTGNTLLAKLFPVSSPKKVWTTSPSADNALALSDSTFRPEKVMSSLTHSYVSAPDGKKAMHAHYPKGSYNFQHKPLGGFSFYAPGPENVDLTTAKEATFGYSVFFPDGFDFQKGGKLFGLYGGDSDSVATGCSGGRRDTRCFSVRLMWRTDGKGEFYTYLPDPSESGFSANKKLCKVAPESECNDTYGASVGRGAFKFATGKWTTVTQRVRLNDNGKSNGEIELWANGKSVINVSGIRMTDSSEGRIRGMQFQTFFGGSSPDFASPSSQDAYFSDFSVAITEYL